MQPSQVNCESGQPPSVLMAGVYDDFDMTVYELASPSASLLTHIVSSPYDHHNFDWDEINYAFGHTFTWDDCDEITEAYLEVRLKPISGGQQETDHLHLWFTGSNCSGAAYTLWSSVTTSGQASTVLLDLDDLPAQGTDLTGSWVPAGVSLLSQMNATGYLDLHIQDDTSVDYAKLTLCCTPDCECGEWGDPKIYLESPTGWGTTVERCDEQIDLPSRVCASEILTITPDYLCDPPDPATCPVSYVIKVEQWGLQGSFIGYYEFPVEEIVGCIEVCIIAFCGDEVCDECCFFLCCTPGCECDGWGDPKIQLASPTGWGTTVEMCDEQIDLPSEVCDRKILTITPDYVCDPPDPVVCPVWYVIDVPNWGIQQSFTGDYELSLTQLSGCVDVCIYAYCGEEACDECCFTLCCHPGSECECGKWDNEKIHLSCPVGWETMVYNCPEQIVLPAEVCASEILTIEPKYVCDPPESTTCPVWYVIDVSQWGLQDDFTDSYDLPLAQLHDCVEVCIIAFCGEEPCDECCFTLCCK